MTGAGGKRYAILVDRIANKAIKKMDKRTRSRIMSALEKLADNPRPDGVKALKGLDGILRVRAGAFRILYTVDDGVLTVLIVKVGHRGDVYR